MSVLNYNITAVRKTIGGIHHRLNEKGLDPAILKRLLNRAIHDLADTLPSKKFAELIKGCREAIRNEDYSELLAGLTLISAILPPMTYGCTLQGQVFEVAGGGIYRKNKAGRVELNTGAILPHFPADTVVNLLDN